MIRSKWNSFKTFPILKSNIKRQQYCITHIQSLATRICLLPRLCRMFSDHWCILGDTGKPTLGPQVFAVTLFPSGGLCSKLISTFRSNPVAGKWYDPVENITMSLRVTTLVLWVSTTLSLSLPVSTSSFISIEIVVWETFPLNTLLRKFSQ